jgi:hypothetical protein
MREAKRKCLEDKGWKVGSAGGFLGLSSSEEAHIALRIRSEPHEPRKTRLLLELDATEQTIQPGTRVRTGR